MTDTVTLPSLSRIAIAALASPSLKGNAREFASPYLRALTHVSDTAEHYGADSVTSVIAYALSNLSAWRGDDARECKRILRAHLAARGA